MTRKDVLECVAIAHASLVEEDERELRDATEERLVYQRALAYALIAIAAVLAEGAVEVTKP